MILKSYKNIRFIKSYIKIITDTYSLKGELRHNANKVILAHPKTNMDTDVTGSK
jgi:hypothetical protein